MEELYEGQKLFIKDARTVVESGGIGIFSSPTGTGKTRSLLTAVMEYVAGPVERDAGYLTKQGVTRVFYSSRTHAQLQQVMGELERLGTGCNSVILGSRKVYCVNDEVEKDKGVDHINERCREMVKEHRCSFYEGHERFDGCGVLDIEDLVSRGRREGFCPYYVSREYAQTCEIVLLPYQLLFSKEGRRSIDIDVKGSIVIVDEAHNICDTVVQMNTVDVCFEVMDKYVRALGSYGRRYGGRMRSTLLLDSTTEILRRICVFGNKDLKDGEETVMRVSEFLIRAGIEDFNMLEIEEYLVCTGMARKLEGFGSDLNLQLARIIQFLSLLVVSDRNGRILCSRSRIRFTPLDPSMYFSEVLECRALLLAGGTMEPVDTLASVFGNRGYHYFSYGSVCNDFLALLVGQGPSGREMVVNHGTREDQSVMREVVGSISNLSNAVRSGGMVCFLPAKSYLEIFRRMCGDRMHRKRVLYEDTTTLEEYCREVGNGPCVLFAVMGGRLSEGINFSDDLCRLLVVVGVPYPNQGTEMRERMEFNGKKYSTLIAMKSVNQTLGRALRHRGDFAVLVLLDRRYNQLLHLVSPWVRRRVVSCGFRDGLSRTNSFLGRRQDV